MAAVFAVALTVTVVGAVPLVALSVRKDATFVAVHVAGLQPIGVAVILTGTPTPVLRIATGFGEALKVHPAADCVTLTD